MEKSTPLLPPSLFFSPKPDTLGDKNPSSWSSSMCLSCRTVLRLLSVPRCSFLPARKKSCNKCVLGASLPLWLLTILVVDATTSLWLLYLTTHTSLDPPFRLIDRRWLGSSLARFSRIAFDRDGRLALGKEASKNLQKFRLNPKAGDIWWEREWCEAVGSKEDHLNLRRETYCLLGSFEISAFDHIPKTAYFLRIEIWQMCK